MIDQMNMHRVVLPQIVDQIEVVYCANFRQVSRSLLEHIVGSNHEPCVVW
jgi:hypothetical protein